MMQNLWDSAIGVPLAVPADDDDDVRSLSEGSLIMASEGGETAKSYPTSPVQQNSFAFKIQDERGRMHRFLCDTRNLTDLITCIHQRLGDDIDHNRLPQLLYDDEDGDQVVLATDGDLVAAVDHAKLAGWKCLRLHLDYSGWCGRRRRTRATGFTSVDYGHADAWATAYRSVAAGAALVAGFGVLAYLRRNG